MLLHNLFNSLTISAFKLALNYCEEWISDWAIEFKEQEYTSIFIVNKE